LQTAGHPASGNPAQSTPFQIRAEGRRNRVHHFGNRWYESRTRSGSRTVQVSALSYPLRACCAVGSIPSAVPLQRQAESPSCFGAAHTFKVTIWIISLAHSSSPFPIFFQYACRFPQWTPAWNTDSLDSALSSCNRSYPSGLAYDPKTMEIAICDMMNDRIVFILPDGTWIGSIAMELANETNQMCKLAEDSH